MVNVGAADSRLKPGVLASDWEIAFALGVSTIDARNSTPRCQESKAWGVEALESFLEGSKVLVSVDSIVSTVVAGVQ